MKLWQKIFLWTLLIVMISVSSTGILLIKNDFNMSIKNQTENTISTHHYMASIISNKVLTKRLQNNLVLLSPDEITIVLDELLRNSTNDSNIIALIDEQNEIIYNNFPLTISKDFFEIIAKNNSTCNQIVNQNGRYRLLVASPLTIENQKYTFVTSTDITNIYNGYQNQFEHIKKMCIILSVGGALLLVIVLKLLLKPLSKLNNTTRAIANGNYHERINIKSYDELGELAKNMNTMADSVEKNINLLEETAKNRSLFINNFTHEMKTPLTSIMGFSDIMRIDWNLPSEEIVEYSNIIFNEADRLKQLSGKLMELITIGETAIKLKKTNATDFFDTLLHSLTPIAANHNINFNTDIENAYIYIDKELFASLICNVIDNAFKASPSNSTILLEAKFQKKEKFYIIKIIDEGIGIPKEELSKITEPFYMVDKARTRKAGGAGLGLALCKNIANIHNAEFNIESELNNGTTVTIILKGEKVKDENNSK